MSSALRSPEELIHDPLYPALKHVVVGTTGLTYYADRDLDLVRRVGRRMATTGVEDCAGYLQLLQDPVRGAPERDELIAAITIGETYFFRHREHFDALRDLVLPDILARNAGQRTLRIWSAGCADGPESYSLSIFLKRDLAASLAGWDVTILGTDINRHSLARAREGIYEEWALRATPEDVRQECFSRRGKQWQIGQAYKECVTFQYHNLVEHAVPSVVNNLFAFDLIVCRNVMIYFGTDLMRRLVQQFYECLVPGAWLLVGPAEPNMSCYTAFRAVNAPGVTLYRRPHTRGVELAIPAELPVFLTPPLLPPIPEPPAFRSPEVETKTEPTSVITLAEVRRHADRGDWSMAARCCEELLEHDNLSSGAHFYYALVLQQMKLHADAERSLRRAIYLDRKSIPPHYYLGLLLQSQGRPAQAARSFQNALDLLRSRREVEVFEDADGITVAELKTLAQMQLDILSEQT